MSEVRKAGRTDAWGSPKLVGSRARLVSRRAATAGAIKVSSTGVIALGTTHPVIVGAASGEEPADSLGKTARGVLSGRVGSSHTGDGGRTA